MQINWLPEPEEQDYPAAIEYLTLLMSLSSAREHVERLQGASTTYRKAKDLLRASELPLLPRTNRHVVKDLKKIRDGQSLSPILLIRGRLATQVPLTIADGYHRICAVWHANEDEEIPCRMTKLELHG